MKYLILAVVLAGCLPRPGDVYEDQLTVARVEVVKVGTGADLASGSGEEREMTTKLGLDPAVTYVLLRIQSSIAGRQIEGRIDTEIEVVPLDEFKRNYRKLE